MIVLVFLGIPFLWFVFSVVSFLAFLNGYIQADQDSQKKHAL